MANRTETATNRLAASTSPYLLQHAENPVDWYPWGEEAFRTARERDRPIFLSIGYSTCHWCHVMAHESFEDPEVAEVLNRDFVSIKVDREERPDVDSVYMSACQMMTGHGGWPLTLFLTPGREPFFAGTYFPKQSRGGRPGLIQLLNRIAELWRERREEVLRSAGQATTALRGLAEGEGGDALDVDVLHEAYRQLVSTFDEHQGGFGSAPKFPTPHNLLFLLRYGNRTGREEATAMVRKTLEAMRRGGIWDHVGYGFHRYSTDARWFVPHFEKMLYDQALLALACTEAWQASGDEDQARTAREIFTYVLRDLRDPGGGFHSAEDADSEGGEGKFYLWTEEELREVLGAEEFALVKEVFRTERRGNFAEEATGRRTGENILHRRRPFAEIAASREMPEAKLRSRWETARRKLFEARAARPRPHRDEKVLTDWNGLMIAALAKGGAALAAPDYVEAARAAADFVLETMRGEDERLLHTFREGRASIFANANDYAFLIFGLIELYQASLDPRYLREARELQSEFERWCWDSERGGFFLSPADSEDLPARPKEVHDGALPSANSVAAWNCVRLSRMTGQPELEERAEAIEGAFAEKLARAPGNFTHMMVALDFRLGPGREVVVVGPAGSDRTDALLDVIRREFWPRAVLLFRPGESGPGEGGEPGGAEPEIVRIADFVREHTTLDGGAAAYVCRDFACERPTTDPEEMRRLLEA